MSILSKLLGKKKEVKTAPKTVKPKSNTVKYSINIAWWEKYPGIDNLIQLNKVGNEPYDGMTAKEIREELEEYDGTVYEYPTINESVSFEDEPDNEYNPEALKILCDGELCGYVPDKNLSRVRGILKNHPDARMELVVKHGSSKFLDFGADGYGEKAKIITEKTKSFPKVEFEYIKK